ncbi:hypothetical protein PoB_002507200 [Plakobranchus ocellatus]|uniref:Uncharacterized protein n=1 Tax=Plakobranchus ocellatus TaxID=259542 RepID=A0AAV3ZTX0_9GAST|nr:hypothetical protein PoB_002507200 [Plakobranchus ocellatus]
MTQDLSHSRDGKTHTNILKNFNLIIVGYLFYRREDWGKFKYGRTGDNSSKMLSQVAGAEQSLLLEEFFFRFLFTVLKLKAWVPSHDSFKIAFNLFLQLIDRSTNEEDEDVSSPVDEDEIDVDFDVEDRASCYNVINGNLVGEENNNHFHALETKLATA